VPTGSPGLNQIETGYVLTVDIPRHNARAPRYAIVNHLRKEATQHTEDSRRVRSARKTVSDGDSLARTDEDQSNAAALQLSVVDSASSVS
jgi:hypothetical protein